MTEARHRDIQAIANGDVTGIVERDTYLSAIRDLLTAVDDGWKLPALPPADEVVREAGPRMTSSQKRKARRVVR